ncbi:putative MFS family arabinose efflux permease [Bacillus ectoiniformans]|uniref:MFS transporter n=1 Tax=Bacillus ectoiniformans TaxID=1494429 RepID=UPI00195E7E43|nr:MFS transporter [Bacillus ectoiniformans]MBM7649635.1 putative MFS family arabinose efflux permease [Bacillus ectoiniformans]
MKAFSSKSLVALISLAISAFAIGTTEFVIVGLLQTVASDLSISVTKAGTLVSGYAAAIAIGTPIVTAMTNRLPKKGLLLSLLVIFIAGNLLSAFAATYSLLLASRIITAVAHGVFFAIAATVATEIVPKDKQSQAISIMFTGLTVATILGVPFGTLIGQQLGWRTTFLAIAVLGVIALIANMVTIDKPERNVNKLTVGDIGRLIGNPRIILALLMTSFGFGGTFVLFTYLTPILETVSNISPDHIFWMLLLYGAATAVGNIIGGKITNHHPVKALRWVFLYQLIALLLQMILLPNALLRYLSIILLGLFAFMMSPGVQSYIVSLAEQLVPSAKDLASALNISGFNLGIAAGSALGGFAVDYLNFLDTAWIGALMVLVALVLAMINYRLDKKQKLF